MENKGIRRSIKIALVIAIVAVVAGTSIYAVSVSNEKGITEAEAKQIALSQVAGADASGITNIREDRDDGRVEYDVEIVHGGFEYDFEISAEDGTIINKSKEKADIAAEPKEPAATEQPSGITLEEAKAIALSQVPGATDGDIVKAFKDFDDGSAEYDIEIRYNGYEYDFEISVSSGEVLGKDVDRIEADDDNDWDDRDDD